MLRIDTKTVDEQQNVQKTVGGGQRLYFGRHRPGAQALRFHTSAEGEPELQGTVCLFAKATGSPEAHGGIPRPKVMGGLLPAKVLTFPPTADAPFGLQGHGTGPSRAQYART